jgi:glucose/arabinose dehydrogenase
MRRLSTPTRSARARAALVALAFQTACAGSSNTPGPDLEADAAAAAEPDAAPSPGPEPSPLPEAGASAAEPDATAPQLDAAQDAEARLDAQLDAQPDADTVLELDAQLDTALPDAGAPGNLDAGSDASAACVPFVAPTDCTIPVGGVLPSELRCTGLYGDFAERRIACGVEAYKPAYELWSDGAEKQRYLRLPPGTKLDVSDAEAFVFPVGTQLWKEFRVTLGGVSRPAETRLLQKSAQGWLYTSYVWNADSESALQQNDGVTDWLGSGHSVPTRDQCRECHAGRSDFALGWDLLLLGEGAQGLSASELLRRDLIVGRSAADVLAPRVPGSELERAALGYLHVNCGVSCHNQSVEASAHDTGLFMRLNEAGLASVHDTALLKSALNKLPSIHAKLPAGGPFYDIRPGDPAHSLVLARMSVRGDETQMPRIGTRRVDAVGVELVTRFIAGMQREQGYPEPAPLDAGASGPDMDASVPDAATESDASVSEAGVLDAAAPDAAAPDASTAEASTADANTPDAGSPDTGAPPCETSTPPPTDNLGVRVVVRDTRLETLSFAAQAPGADDWYLVEMRGRILRLHDGVLDTTPFLDLSSTIDLGAGFDQTTFTYDERGLVGLAFAPDYASSGLFYVAITPSKSNALGLVVNHDMVLEYQRPAQSGAAPVLRRTVLELPSAAVSLGNIHNANTVRFGPDGMLYVGMGDGGGVNCNDAEPNSAQNINLAFGKILRFDLSQPAPYAAQDNPFVGVGDARVFHYGLRNPFRFSFDRLTGDLFIGDVGQDRYEEIDHAPRGSRGLNFGWANLEANTACPGPARPLRSGSTPTPPIFVADRRGTGSFSDYRAITGGVVYRGTGIPSLQGAYLFGDYYGKRMAALYRCGTQTSGISILRKNCDPNLTEPCLSAPAGGSSFLSLTAIVEDHAGEAYFVANGNSLLQLVPR